ncbi:YgfZ/GcvT domain-containing protein [Dasania marina]|uniref:CAF17-like 4Fe-4S cluster assembly/insertion protein YgfZ n=1 Tax=Dasania marina TaxID=471499 RepID=UPI00036E69C8|nr:folate-binding protein YgfZ [Dasania marina]
MPNPWTDFFNRFAPVKAPASTDSNVVCLLDHYGLLATQGLDAAKFLQGQASCDINAISAEQAHYGSFSSPKGRAYAHFLASKNSADNYLLRLPQSILGGTQQQLAKYLAFFKAQQIDCSAEYSLLGLKGPAASANIRSCFGDCPSQPLASISAADYSIIAIDPSQELYECWIKNSVLADYWPRLSNGLHCADSSLWQLQLIRLGIAELSASNVDQYIPQMLNYQLTGAISFTKGCFTGQEIVARMQYKGKVKRRLYRIALTGSAILTEGMDIINNSTNAVVGQIINIAASKPNTQEALAVLNIDPNQEQSLSVVTEQATTAVTMLDLPYAIN